MKKYFIAGLVILLAVVGFVLISDNSADINLAEAAGVDTVTVYKSPTCGCCDLYSAYLKRYGVDVVVENVEDMEQIKNQHNVPSSLYSCHTTVIGDSVVEGHIPVEAVVSMFENSDVSNIGMPGMPSGSPGMPGAKTGLFTVYSFDGGEVSEFIKI